MLSQPVGVERPNRTACPGRCHPLRCRSLRQHITALMRARAAEHIAGYGRRVTRVAEAASLGSGLGFEAGHDVLSGGNPCVAFGCDYQVAPGQVDVGGWIDP